MRRRGRVTKSGIVSVRPGCTGMGLMRRDEREVLGAGHLDGVGVRLAGAVGHADAQLVGDVAVGLHREGRAGRPEQRDVGRILEGQLPDEAAEEEGEGGGVEHRARAQEVPAACRPARRATCSE